MINCLSSSKFANLLFVDVQIDHEKVIALFDTGANRTVITRSLMQRLHASFEEENFRVGNNNGVVRMLQSTIITHIQIGDISIKNCRVLVVDDAYFDFTDTIFPAKMLLGRDIISQYRWRYSSKEKSLLVSLSQRIVQDSYGPIVFCEYNGHGFKARVDTGHTSSILNASWYSRLTDVEYHESEIVGVGTSQCKPTFYVKDIKLRYQNQMIHLRNVDICDKIYGQPDEIETLFGFDFLEGKDWLLEQDFKLNGGTLDGK